MSPGREIVHAWMRSGTLPAGILMMMPQSAIEALIAAIDAAVEGKR